MLAVFEVVSRKSKVWLQMTLWTAALMIAGCNNPNFAGRSVNAQAPSQSKEFQQEIIALKSISYTQGNKGSEGFDSFQQGEWGALDLLVVVDNSGSMKEEQENLATKLDPLISKIDRSDWRIAVVTTDTRDGCQRALINKSDTDRVQRFKQAINAGTSGHGTERLFLQAVNGLKGECLTTPWVRPNSTVAVLFLSDEDNCHIDESQGYGCTGAAELEAKFLTDYLGSIRTIGQDARAYGLIWHPSQAKAACSTALAQGQKLSQAIAATGGTWGTICDSDYTPTLEKISNDIAKILKYEFTLAHDPTPDTVSIMVNGQPWTKFQVSGRVVKFTQAPDFGAQINVSYRYGASGSQLNELALPDVPVADSLQIMVNDQQLSATDYSFDEQSGKVVLKTQPADNAVVKIGYKPLGQLKKEFSIGTVTNPSSIKVTVDGAAVTAFTYDAAAGVVKFDKAPAENTKIKIVY